MRWLAIVLVILLAPTLRLSANPYETDIQFAGDVHGNEARLHFLSMREPPLGLFLLRSPNTGAPPSAVISDWRVVPAQWVAGERSKANGGSGLMDFTRYECTVSLAAGKTWYRLILPFDEVRVEGDRLVPKKASEPFYPYTIGRMSLEPGAASGEVPALATRARIGAIAGGAASLVVGAGLVLFRRRRSRRA